MHNQKGNKECITPIMLYLLAQEKRFLPGKAQMQGLFFNETKSENPC